jgi:transcriptional regulator with XRE-family HTH domain
MSIAAEGAAMVPARNYGRLGWFQEQFRSRYDIGITNESVRKWFSGETKPRQESIRRLAEILGVDETWLTLGTDPGVGRKEQIIRDATADASVNILAGIIAMDGGTPSFPNPDDARAKGDLTDIIAIIKGGSYAIHVAAASPHSDGWAVSVPVAALSNIILVLVNTQHHDFKIVELDCDMVEELGKRKSGAIEIVFDRSFKTGGTTWRVIETFAERL